MSKTNSQKNKAKKERIKRATKKHQEFVTQLPSDVVNIYDNISHKHCKLIYNLCNELDKEFGKNEFEYGLTFNTDSQTKQILISTEEGLMSFTIDDNLTPKQICNMLKRKLDKTVDRECIICFDVIGEDLVGVNCTKCRQSICVVCYGDLFLSGGGIITCPMCRHQIGHDNWTKKNLQKAHKQMMSRCKPRKIDSLPKRLDSCVIRKADWAK